MQDANIATLRALPDHAYLESTELFAYLCYVASLSRRKVAVISPDFFGSHASSDQKNKHQIRSRDNAFMEEDDFEVVLIPVYVPNGNQDFENAVGHWVRRSVLLWIR